MLEQVFWIAGAVGVGGFLVFVVLPMLHVMFSDRSSGWAKFGWILAILFLSLLGYAAFLIFTQKKEPASAEAARPPQPASVVQPVAISAPGNLAEDAYRLWLVEQYQIKKNDVLNQYVCSEKLFPTVDAALAHAHDIENRRRNDALAAESQAAQEQAARAEAKRLAAEQRAEQIRRERVEREKRWARQKPYVIGGFAIFLLAGAGLIYWDNLRRRRRQPRSLRA